MSLSNDVDLSVCDGNIDEIAQGTAALAIHAYNALGVRVAKLDGIAAPMSLQDRLTLLVFAVGLLRCQVCGCFAPADGRFCLACAPCAGEMQMGGGR